MSFILYISGPATYAATNVYIGIMAIAGEYKWVHSLNAVQYDNFQTQPTNDDLTDNPNVALFGGHWIVNPGTEPYAYICQEGLTTVNNNVDQALWYPSLPDYNP